MGLRQQAPGNPTLAGPWVTSLASSLFWVFVNLGGLPGAFLDFKPAAPFNSKALTHKRMDSSLTCKFAAITEYGVPSATANIASIRLTIRMSPEFCARLSILRHAFRVWFLRLILTFFPWGPLSTPLFFIFIYIFLKYLQDDMIILAET